MDLFETASFWLDKEAEYITECTKKESEEMEDDKMLDEGATEDAKKTLDAIIASLEKGDKDNDILKMANGMLDFYNKEKSFSPKQAEWIYNTSKAMFK